MGSKWRAILEERIPATSTTSVRVADIEETDPSYFVAKDEKGNILAEGELSRFKLKLPEQYLYAPIKRFTRDAITMVATVQF